MYDCFTSSHSVYFEGEFDLDFYKKYKGVTVNARCDGGYGHFAIRKPATFWFKLPKFIKKLFPYKWVMWKSDSEKLFSLDFNDWDNSISIVAAMHNSSYRKLTFDKETYDDLKSCIPIFLEHVGYKFNIVDQGSCMSLVFENTNE
jgi:hypothetical protein